MRNFISLFLACCTLFVAPDVASADPIRCDHCYMDYEFRNMAQTRGTGSHLVYNLSENTVQLWVVGETPIIVDPMRGSVGAQSGGDTTKGVVPPAAIHELNAAHQVYVHGGSTLRPTIVVPVSMLSLPPAYNGATVYRFLSDSNFQSQVLSRAGDPGVITSVTSTSFLTALADLLSVATSFFGLQSEAGLNFRIVFSDGSYIEVRVSLDNPNASYLYNSARTSGGQYVPQTSQEVNGTWYNYGENMSNVIDHFSMLGATISYVGGGGSVVGITCAGGICVVTRIQ